MRAVVEHEIGTRRGVETREAPGRVAPDLVGLPLTGGPLRLARCILRYETARARQFIDITDDVERVVASSGVADGWVTVFSRHTTAAIKINEHEPELLKDLSRLLMSVAPESGAYFHNDFTVRSVNMNEDECPNGHAHCQHLLLGASETIPLVDARLLFGRWQRIFVSELDHGRARDVVVSVMGCEPGGRTASEQNRSGEAAE